MIMMSYSWRWSSLQLTGQADFWHPTGCRGRNPALSRLAADFTSADVITVQARWPCDARWVRQG